MQFLKNVLTSRFGWALALLHAILAIVIVAVKEPQQGFSYHFSDEPIYYKALFWADYPAMTITGLLFTPFLSGSEGVKDFWNVAYYSVLLGLATCQWLLVGYGISKWLDRGKPLS